MTFSKLFRLLYMNLINCPQFPQVNYSLLKTND